MLQPRTLAGYEINFNYQNKTILVISRGSGAAQETYYLTTRQAALRVTTTNFQVVGTDDQMPIGGGDEPKQKETMYSYLNMFPANGVVLTLTSTGMLNVQSGGAVVTQLDASLPILFQYFPAGDLLGIYQP